MKRQLAAFATTRARVDLAAAIATARPADKKSVKAASAAIETLRGMPIPQPLIGDAIGRWLPVSLVQPLHAAGIRTLADRGGPIRLNTNRATISGTLPG